MQVIDGSVAALEAEAVVVLDWWTWTSSYLQIMYVCGRDRCNKFRTGPAPFCGSSPRDKKYNATLYESIDAHASAS